jgi:hypothetical protein
MAMKIQVLVFNGDIPQHTTATYKLHLLTQNYTIWFDTVISI